MRHEAGVVQVETLHLCKVAELSDDTGICAGKTAQQIVVLDNNETETLEFPCKAYWVYERGFMTAKWDKAYIVWK